MKIVKQELSSGRFNNATKMLNECSTNANKIIATLNDFINSQKATGKSYTQIKNAMSEYVALFEQSKNIATELSNAITKSLTHMSNFMEDYDVIDDSKREEISARLTALNNSIYNVNLEIAKLEDGTEKTKLLNNLASYEATKNQVQKLYSKIEALGSEDSSQYGSIVNISESLTNLHSKTSDVKSLKFNI